MLRNHNLVPLSHDHQRALALCVLTERSIRSDPSAQNLAARARQIVETFESEIRSHFHSEEQLLFPALRVFPSLSDLISELLREHTRLLELVTSLNREATLDAIEDFCRLLPVHIRKEERVLFQQAQEMLSTEQLDELGRQLAVSPHCSRRS